MNSRKIKKQNRKKEKYRRSVKLGRKQSVGAGKIIDGKYVPGVIGQFKDAIFPESLRDKTYPIIGKSKGRREEEAKEAATAKAEAKADADVMATAATKMAPVAQPFSIGTAVFYSKGLNPVRVIINSKDADNEYEIKKYPGYGLDENIYQGLRISAKHLFLKEPISAGILGYYEDDDGKLAETDEEGVERRKNAAKAEAEKAEAEVEKAAEAAKVEEDNIQQRISDTTAYNKTKYLTFMKNKWTDPNAINYLIDLDNPQNSIEGWTIPPNIEQAWELRKEIRRKARSKFLGLHSDRQNDKTPAEKDAAALKLKVFLTAYKFFDEHTNDGNLGGSKKTHKKSKSHKKRRTQKRHKKSKKHRRLRKTRR